MYRWRTGQWLLGVGGVGDVTIKGYYKGVLECDETVLYPDGGGGGFMNLYMYEIS